MSLTITGEAANKAIKVRFYWFDHLLGDGFVDLDGWDRMKNDLNEIVEDDNPVWVVSHVEYEENS